MGGGVSKPASGSSENISINPINEPPKNKTTSVAKEKIPSETKTPSSITSSVSAQKHPHTEKVATASLGIRFEDPEESLKAQEKTLKPVTTTIDNSSKATSPLTTTGSLNTQRNTPITDSLPRRIPITSSFLAKTKRSQDLEGLPKKRIKPELEALDLETRKVNKTLSEKIEPFLDPSFKPSTEDHLLKMLSLANLIKKENPEKFFELYKKAILASKKILDLEPSIESRPDGENKKNLLMLLELLPTVRMLPAWTLPQFTDFYNEIKKTPITMRETNKKDFLSECLKKSPFSYPPDQVIIVNKLPNGPEKTSYIRRVFKAIQGECQRSTPSFPESLDSPLPNCPDKETTVLCNFIITLLELDNSITEDSATLIRSLPNSYSRKVAILKELEKCTIKPNSREITKDMKSYQKEMIDAEKITKLIKNSK